MENYVETYHVIVLENGQKPHDILGSMVSTVCTDSILCQRYVSIVGILLQQSILKLEKKFISTSVSRDHFPLRYISTYMKKCGR